MKTFSDAFKEHLNETKRPVSEVSSTSGVSQDALYKLKYGKTQNMAVDDAVRVAAAFDETVEQFMGLNLTQSKSKLNEQLDLLTEQEREILLASITAVLAVRAKSSLPDAASEE